MVSLGKMTIIKQYPTHNDDLHIAVALNHFNKAKRLLSEDYNLVQQLDVNGNQPLHIAARSSCADILRLLIEYDAPLGRRNYEGLTPIGVARLHCQKNAISLFNQHYKKIDNEGEEPEKHYYKRINLNSIPSQSIIRKVEEDERMKQARAHWFNIQNHHGAKLMQQLVRKYLATKQARMLQIKFIKAFKIQCLWMKFQDQKQIKAAITIQSFQRMITVKSYFEHFLKERLSWHQASRILASMIQRVWRGHKGRSIYRRLIAMHILPDPSEAKSFDTWKHIQEISHPPVRTWNNFSEYVLWGKPTTWNDRAIKRDGHYRDVLFWTNNLTQKASWIQPKIWADSDAG